jgi:hypothetical protein
MNMIDWFWTGVHNALDGRGRLTPKGVGVCKYAYLVGWVTGLMGVNLRRGHA